MTTKELVARVQQLDTPMYSAEDVRQRLGISTMSLMTDSDPKLPVNEASLKKMVESGVRKIEIGADFGPSHFPYHDAQAVTELRSFYADNGAEIYSVHSPYRGNFDEWDFDDISRLIEAMAAVGAKVLLLHFDIWGRAAWERGLETMRRLADICRPHGIWLSIETAEEMTHDSNFTDWFDFPEVGVCCDTGHAGAAYASWNTMSDWGYVAQTLASANGKLNHLHLSDVSTTALPRYNGDTALKPRHDHFSPGRGSSIWTTKFQCFKAMAYPGCFIFEIWSEDDERFERLAEFPERLVAGELGRGVV